MWTPTGAPSRGRAFFVLRPEDAGHPEPPRTSEEPLYVFDTWLGDDLVGAHPHFLVTAALKASLETLAEPTGFRASHARTRPSLFLERQRPELSLPTFWKLEIDGAAGVHDLGLTADGSLVVSQRVLDHLVSHSIHHAWLTQYASAAEGRGGAKPAPRGRA